MNSATKIAKATTPVTDATTTLPLGLPPTTTSTSATTGRSSFAKLFQMPETSSDKVIGRGLNPHDRYMATFMPMPNAPPTGTVFATAVDACEEIVDCPKVIPGSDAICAG